MDRKQREDFDSTLNSGVGSSSWANIEARAWERLQEGEYDKGTDTGVRQGGGE
jgi:hypothetical protein